MRTVASLAAIGPFGELIVLVMSNNHICKMIYLFIYLICTIIFFYISNAIIAFVSLLTEKIL